MLKKRVGVLPVLALLLCLIGFFIWRSSTLGSSIQVINGQLDQSRMQLTQEQNTKAQLEQELSLVGTDAYIESQARSEYSYMKKDEIRFIITNPDKLYQEDENDNAVP